MPSVTHGGQRGEGQSRHLPPSGLKKLKTISKYKNIINNCNETSWYLGLIRIHGNCPAEKLLSLLQERLGAFELKLEADVAAATSDVCKILF